MNRRTVFGHPLPSQPPKAQNRLTHHALTEETTNQTPVDWKEVEEAEGHRRENPPSSASALQSLRVTPGWLIGFMFGLCFLQRGTCSSKWHHCVTHLNQILMFRVEEVQWHFSFSANPVCFLSSVLLCPD